MSEERIETKTVRLPLALAERLAALPVAERAAIVERGFSVSSMVVVEPGAEASPAPAAVVVEPTSAESLPVSEQALRRAPGTWVEVTVKVHPRLKKIFESLDPQTHSAFLEFCAVGARDTAHVERIAGMHFEFAKLAMQLRKLLKIFSGKDARAPHLQRRLINAVHRWGNRTLDLIGEPVLDLPGVGLANAPVAPRAGVPSSYEPITLWLPARMCWRLDEIQAHLVATYAQQDATWDKQYEGAFIRPPLSENAPETSPLGGVVEPVVTPEPSPENEQGGPTP